MALQPIPFEVVSEWPTLPQRTACYSYAPIAEALRRGQWVRIPQPHRRVNIRTGLNANYGLYPESRVVDGYLYLRMSAGRGPRRTNNEQRTTDNPS